MESVTVKKADLMQVLNDNMVRHRGIFEEAVTGYREEAVRLLDEHIQRIKKGKLRQVYVSLPLPQDHTKDYSRVLKMLSMSVDDAIELSEADFRQYVQDDWSWRNEFLNTASTYNSSTARAALGAESEG